MNFSLTPVRHSTFADPAGRGNGDMSRACQPSKPPPDPSVGDVDARVMTVRVYVSESYQSNTLRWKEKFDQWYIDGGNEKVRNAVPLRIAERIWSPFRWQRNGFHEVLNKSQFWNITSGTFPV